MEVLKILERKESLDWEYDEEADVLYISLGKPEPAEGIDIGEGIIVRIKPETNEVVGLTIMGFSKRTIESLKG